ncbi:MAG: hypothetical protein ABWY55_02335 [Microbacterium sp.]
MSALIMGWNRDKWDRWEPSYEDIVASLQDPDARYRTRWSVGGRREVAIGTDAWLLRQGRVRGLIGHGRVLSEPVEDVHFTDPRKTRRYVLVEFDGLLDETDVIPPEVLRMVVPEVAWHAQYQSGNSVPPVAEERLARLWEEITGRTVPAA